MALESIPKTAAPEWHLNCGVGHLHTSQTNTISISNKSTHTSCHIIIPISLQYLSNISPIHSNKGSPVSSAIFNATLNLVWVPVPTKPDMLIGTATCLLSKLPVPWTDRVLYETFPLKMCSSTRLLP